MRYQCTECDETHATFDAAAQCHWGIGGVIEVPTSNHWYVNGEGYDSLLDACEEALFARAFVLDDNDKIVADYTGAPSVNPGRK
jgi:hypothetical protein